MQLDISYVFTVPGAASVVASGWTKNLSVDTLYGPSDLSSLDDDEIKGLGLWLDCNEELDTHLIDSQSFVQLDVRDLLKYVNNGDCINPKITIGNVLAGYGFEILGSFVAGTPGNSLLKQINKNSKITSYPVDLFGPMQGEVAAPLYPYISVRALPSKDDANDCLAGGAVFIKDLTFQVCEFGQ